MNAAVKKTAYIAAVAVVSVWLFQKAMDKYASKAA